MLAQDGFDLTAIQTALAATEPGRDPRRLGGQFRVIEILLSPRPVEEDHRHEPAARHEAHEEQPPLKLGHQRQGPT